MGYMVGELFFKDHDRNIDPEEDDDLHLPYTVLQEYQNYEKRHYPSVTFICNKTKIDTAADPLAGLERMNPYDVMMSRRYQKNPKHEEEDHEQTEEEQQDKATSRHAVVSPPEPVENGRVYLYTRPAMQVYVRTFGGFA